MAKALKKPQPLSSVERFFANSSVGEALAQSEVPATGRADESPDVPPVHQEPRSDQIAAQHETPAPESPAARTTRARAAVSVLPPPIRSIVVPPAERTGEPVEKQREFQLTRSTDETLEDLVTLYKRATGSELTRSHVLRAVLKAVAEQMPQLRREAASLGPLRRPSNAKGFEEAREEFEEQIKQAFVAGMKG